MVCIAKNMTYGEFVSFVLLTGIFLGPIQQINAVIEMYPKGAAGFKRFASLIDQTPDEKDDEDAIEVQQLKGISFLTTFLFNMNQTNPCCMTSI